jgi:hypothetical protein
MFGPAVHFHLNPACEIECVLFKVVGPGHRTPKGVRNFRTLENYKYCTPPE